MEKIIEIRIREFGPIAYAKINKDDLKIGDYLIFEQDRGLDYACIVAFADSTPGIRETKLIKRIIRRASEQDLKQIEQNQKKAKEAVNTCLGKIQEHKLSMKLVGAELPLIQVR